MNYAYFPVNIVSHFLGSGSSTMKATSRLAGHSKIELWLHHKKDGFFLQNLFILGRVGNFTDNRYADIDLS